MHSFLTSINQMVGGRPADLERYQANFSKARYCNGFPYYASNIDLLERSIDSMSPIPSFPFQPCLVTKMVTVYVCPIKSVRAQDRRLNDSGTF